MTPTAILSALKEEQQGLLELLQNPQQVTRSGREFWRGNLHGQPVVLALSRVGKVAAATTATTLVEHFGVGRIIFTGVAGGIGPGVNVGDVVIASSFVQHDLDASPLFPRYQVPLYGRSVFDCDSSLSAMINAATQAILVWAKGQFNGIFDNKAVKIHQGLVASGDKFVCGAVESSALQSALQDAGFQPLAVEMEGAAVAQVCFDYNVPFAAVRIISDRADDAAHVDFQKFVTHVASHYSVAIIDGLMSRLPAIQT
jgi:adenosylhomocysteine nucleosidase